MLSKLTGFFQREPVLSIAALAAIVTAFFAPFSLKAIGEAIDWRVLALLFCLMAVVQGLEACGACAPFWCFCASSPPCW